MGVDYMNGWDTMLATSQSNVNAALALAYSDGLLPPSTNTTVTFQVFGINVSADFDVTLAAWTLTGGSGKNVIVTIPFTGGTLTLSGTSYPMTGVSMNVTCELAYIQSAVQPTSGTNYDFQISFNSPNAIVAVQVVNPPSGLDADTLDICLTNYLQQALAGNTYTIATVNLGAISADYPYLVPTIADYAVDTNSTDADSTIFAVQMLTINSTPGNQDVVPGTVPGGTPTCDSAALVSNQILAQQLLLPGLAQALGVATSSLTAVNTGGTWTIINSGDITLNQEYNPVLSSISAYVDNDEVNISINGSVVPTAGITITFSIQTAYTTQLTTNNGTQTLSLVQSGSPTVNHTVTVASWVIITAAALAALVLATLGPVVAVVIAGIEALIIYLVATIANNQAGSLLGSSLPASVATPVSWTNLQTFTIGQALLPTPLQLGGTIPALSN